MHVAMKSTLAGDSRVTVTRRTNRFRLIELRHPRCQEACDGQKEDPADRRREEITRQDGVAP